MVAFKTIDIKNNFSRISEILNNGETVLISRPHNQNYVMLTEKEYNQLRKASRKASGDLEKQRQKAANLRSFLSFAATHEVIEPDYQFNRETCHAR